MGLLSYKTIMIVSLALMVVSGLAGLVVYYAHAGVIKSLGGIQTLGEALDNITYLEYRVKDASGEYLVKIYNDPGERKGRIEVYRGGELAERYYYEYGNNQLILLEREVGGERRPLDPVEYEEPFLTSVAFEVGQEGGVVGVKAFPGIGPVYILHYLEGVLGIDWPQLIEPRGAASPPVNLGIEYTRVSSGAGSFFGVRITVQPDPTLFFTPLGSWGLGPIVVEAAKVDGVPVAVKFTYAALLETGEQTVEWELVDLETR